MVGVRKPGGRRIFITVTLALLLYALPWETGATVPPDRPRSHPAGQGCRILIIDSEEGEPYDSFRVAFVEELTRRGCPGGSEPAFQRYSLSNEIGRARRVFQIESFPEYDAVVLQGTIAAIAFHELDYGNLSQHYFFGNVTDPISVGLIDAFDRAPPANFTGISYPVPPVERLRFIRRLMPEARTIGLIHTDMPQSLAYNERLRDALAREDLRDLQVVTREVPFVPGEHGMRRSIVLAREYVTELNGRVDLFLSPNDQMGVREEFARMVAGNASAPLIGLGEYEVHSNLGATASLFASTTAAGRELATMVYKYVQGADFAAIHPPEPAYDVAINPVLASRFGIRIPEQYAPHEDEDATTVH